jgi:hypothetical protein
VLQLLPCAACSTADALYCFIYAALQILDAEGIDLAPFAAGIEAGLPDAAARADLLLVCADRISTFGDQLPSTEVSWCDAQQNKAAHERLQALALLRRLLVLSRQQPGPAGLLCNTAAVDSLQELLPFTPLLQLATLNLSPHGSRNSGAQRLGEPGDMRNQNLLFLLPHAQRAWLLGDAAAAVLLPAKDGTR